MFLVIAQVGEEVGGGVTVPLLLCIAISEYII